MCIVHGTALVAGLTTSSHKTLKLNKFLSRKSATMMFCSKVCYKKFFSFCFADRLSYSELLWYVALSAAMTSLFLPTHFYSSLARRCLRNGRTHSRWYVKFYKWLLKRVLTSCTGEFIAKFPVCFRIVCRGFVLTTYLPAHPRPRSHRQSR